MKKKVILSSVLTIVLCLSLIVGASFALFTSKSEVNIAVTSGTVKVIATISDMQYKTLTNKTWTDAVDNATTFDNIGGSAEIRETQEGFSSLTMTKIVPGDGVKMNVNIKNESDVVVKYRTVISAITGDMKELDIKINETDYTGSIVYDTWKTLPVGSADIVVPVSIELSEDATEQGINCELAITVMAVQGNAEVTDPDVVIDNSTENAQTVFTNAVKGDESVVYLEGGDYTMPSMGSDKDITISGTKDTVLTLAPKTTLGGSNVTISGVTIQGWNAGNKGGVFDNFHSEQMDTAESIVYENCTFIDTLTVYSNSTFKNCTFNTTYAEYSVYCYDGTDIVFEGCSFNGAGKYIKVYDEGNCGKTVTVNNCTFTSTNANKAAVEIDSRFSTYFVYINDCTLGTNISKLWNSDEGEDTNTNVCQDGTWYVGNAAGLDKALKDDAKNMEIVVMNNMSYNLSTGLNIGNANTESVTIKGASEGVVLTLSNDYRNYFNLTNANATLYIEDLTVENAQNLTDHFYNYTTHINCDAVITNVTFTRPVYVSENVTIELNNVDFNIPTNGNSCYALFIAAGANVEYNGGSIVAQRGIKISDEDTDGELTTLKVSDVTFTTSAKGAILVTSTGGADISLSNVNIANCAADVTNEVWVDEDRAGYFDKVVVIGGNKVQE